MKIKVTKEGREGIFIPEKESLIAWIKEQKFEQIHNFIPTANMMLGADHDVESVIKDIEKSDRLAILTGDAQANNLGHALSLIFENKMEMYDIGKITEEDLDIKI
jgi:hypothetical protein